MATLPSVARHDIVKKVNAFVLVNKKMMKNSSLKNNSSSFLLTLLAIVLTFTLQIHPSSAKWNKYFNQADWQILYREFDKAIGNYLKGINLASLKEMPEVWDDLGFAYLQRKELEKAKEYLSLTLTFRPENFNPRFYLALAYILDNEIEAASKHLKIIEKNVYFSPDWINRIKKNSSIVLKKPNGKRVEPKELERMNKETGVYLEEKASDEIIIHLGAFDERNEGAFGLALKIVHKAKEEFEATEKEFIIFHKLKHHNTTIIPTLHNKFLTELEKGKIEEAVKTLEKCLEADDQSFLINHNLAVLYFDTGMLEKAEVYCARALWFMDAQSLSKDNVTGCYDLMGNIYFHQKIYDQALEEFKNILQIDKQNSPAHYNLGSTYYALNDWKNAELEWKDAIQYDKKNGRLKKERSISTNELEISYIVRKKPVSYLSYISLAQLHYDQNLIDLATAECERAIKLNPSEPQSYLLMAKISIARNEFRKAKDYLDRYLYLGGKKNEEVMKLIDILKNNKILSSAL